MRDVGRRCLWAVAGLFLLTAPAGWAAPAAEEPAEPVDWPTVISKLQQEAYNRPNGRARQQLALAHNNYGVVLGTQGQWDLAATQLEEALRLDEANPQYQSNLGRIRLNQAYETYQQHRTNHALRYLDAVTALQPKLIEAYLLRGEIEYGRQKLKEAKAAWERARELNPAQPGLAERLAQVSSELPVESKFERLSQAYFDLRYEEQQEGPSGFDIRDALLEARRLVGSDFAYWPSHKIVVLIYSAESFRALRQQTPDWVAGQFDGKIRVPLPGRQLDTPAVKRILFHEYTHALIYDLAKGRCPVWINEGLAEYEGRKQQSTPFVGLTGAHAANRLIPWTQLSSQFAFSLSVEQVSVGYEEACSVVTYVIERYGFWRVRRLLKTLGEGQAWEAALTGELRSKLPKLEAEWRAWLPQWLDKAR